MHRASLPIFVQTLAQSVQQAWQQMRHFSRQSLPLLVVLLVSVSTFLAACSKDDNSNAEADYWKSLNDRGFSDTLRTARQAIAQAQAAYGDNWPEHTPWRVFPSYTLAPGARAVSTDSIVVRVLNSPLSADAALNAPRPLYTDTTEVAYMGRFLATTQYPEGQLFDFTGPSRQFNDVFNPLLASTTKMAVSNVVVGFTTALQQMHAGERWRVFIPWQLGYGSSATRDIPGHSMLIFDLHLYRFWRAH